MAVVYPTPVHSVVYLITSACFHPCKVPDGLIKNAKWIDNNFLSFSQDAKNLSDLLVKISGG
jgi:hypothetical protein